MPLDDLVCSDVPFISNELNISLEKDFIFTVAPRMILINTRDQALKIDDPVKLYRGISLKNAQNAQQFIFSKTDNLLKAITTAIS